MAKTNVGQFDTTAANNTDVDSNTTAEGWGPADVNNAVRALMALMAEYANDFRGYTATGTDTYAVTTSTTYTAYTEVHGIVVTFTNANTGAATLNVDTLGAAAIKKNGGQALVAGDIPAGGTFFLTHDGTDFEIVGKLPSVDSSPDDLITTRGDIIYGNSSAAAARLALGGASKVLISDGTDISWGSPITRATAQATTSGTSVSFTGIPSGVRRLTVVLNAVSLSGTDLLLIRLGISTGLVTTGYDASSNALNQASGTTGTDNTQSFPLFRSTAAQATSGSMVFTNIDGNIWVGSGVFDLGDDNNQMTAAGVVDLGGTLDRCSLIANTGTLDGGSVNIFYE